VHDLHRDDLGLLEVHPARGFQRRGLGQLGLHGEKEGQHHRAVAQPLHLGFDQAAAGPAQVLGLLHAAVDIVLLVQLVDIADQVRVLEGAPADQF